MWRLPRLHFLLGQAPAPRQPGVGGGGGPPADPSSTYMSADGTEPQASGANSDYEHEFTGGRPAQLGQGDGTGAPRRPRGRNGGGGIIQGERKGSFLARVDVADTAA